MNLKNIAGKSHVTFKYFLASNGISSKENTIPCGEAIIPYDRISSLSFTDNSVVIGNDVFTIHSNNRESDVFMVLIYTHIKSGLIHNEPKTFYLYVDNMQNLNIVHMLISDGDK